VRHHRQAPALALPIGRANIPSNFLRPDTQNRWAKHFGHPDDVEQFSDLTGKSQPTDMLAETQVYKQQPTPRFGIALLQFLGKLKLPCADFTARR
jgi:hypothetical protein